MTTHPNLLLIQRFFQAYANSDASALQQILSPTIRWTIPGRHPLSGVKNGVDEVLQYFAQLGQLDFHAEPIVLGVNEHFVIDCHHNWSNRAEGENFKAMSCLLWKIENNQIVDVYNFPADQHQVDAFFTAAYADSKT